MKRIAAVILSLAFISGCATYKFQQGKAPYDKGYVATRDGYAMPEYTLGENNSVPDQIGLAKERFRARRRTVEHYYKKMGHIENRFKMAFYDPAAMFAKLVVGVFRLPFIAASDYKYDHNPAYKAKIVRIEEEKDLREETRIAKLKERLSIYVQKSLAHEKPAQKAESVNRELASIEGAGKQTVEAELDRVQRKQKSTKEKPRSVKKQPRMISAGPSAVIIARPQKGYSPLSAHFYGSRSRSPHGKIVSYSWDFGDGDTSDKANPRNTYYSGSSQPQDFTVTLTVTDAKGNTATNTTTIKVLNK